MEISNLSLVLCIFILLSGLILDRKYITLYIPFKKEIFLKDFFLVFTMGFLIIIAGFRGDFTQDYLNYDWLFKHDYSTKSWIDVFENKEFGYAILNKISYMISSETFVLMLLVSVITMYCYYKMFRNYSEDYFLSIIMLVIVDNYIISFNLMRNICACALFLLASQLIWRGKLYQYIISILMISTIHKSAVLMLPIYWILRFDYKKKKNQLVTLLVIAVLIFFVFEFDKIVWFVQRMLGYNWEENMYGVEHGSLGSLMKTIMLFMIVILLVKKVNYSDIKERVWVNGCLVNIIFQLCSYRMLMMQRIGFYFSVFFLLLIPLLTSRTNIEKQRIYKIGITVFIFLYALLFRSNNIYYTFWNNKFL